eukprot:sb/3469113/
MIYSLSVIPDEREIIVLRHSSAKVCLVRLCFERRGVLGRIDLDIQSAAIGRLYLELQTRSEVIPAGLHRHDYGEDGLRLQQVNTKCHYIGSEAGGERDITAAFSDCTGRFKGRIMTDEGTWYVTYDAGNYVLFHHSSIPVPDFLMGADYSGITEDIVDLKRSKREEEGEVVVHPLPTKTLEMVIVTDRAMWQFFNTKIDAVEEFALATVYHIDELPPLVIWGDGCMLLWYRSRKGAHF